MNSSIPKTINIELLTERIPRSARLGDGGIELNSLAVATTGNFDQFLVPFSVKKEMSTERSCD